MLKENTKKTALILLVDERLAEMAQDTIQQMGHRCMIVKSSQDAEAQLKKEPVDLILCKIRNKADDFKLFDTARKYRPTCRGIAIIDESLEAYFPELLIRAYPQNLIADNSPIDFGELVITIQKILSGNIFGLDKYNIPIHESLKVARSNQKYEYIHKVRDFFLEQGVQERFTQNVELILNELLMNAIFDAPVNEKGERLYYQRDRASIFDLAPREQPVLEYGLSDNLLGVSVSDPFGSIQEGTFYSYVNRCFSERSIAKGQQRGAGLGLYMVFKSLNQLVMNVAYNKRTEIIALIDYKSSLRELKKSRHSFHHFHTGEH